MNTADKILKRVQSVRFFYEAKPQGYGVDPHTHIGTPPKKKTDEERLLVTLVVEGEAGERIVDGKYASAIYEQVRQFLNDQKT